MGWWQDGKLNGNCRCFYWNDEDNGAVEKLEGWFEQGVCTGPFRKESEEFSYWQYTASLFTDSPNKFKCLPKYVDALACDDKLDKLEKVELSDNVKKNNKGIELALNMNMIEDEIDPLHTAN